MTMVTKKGDKLVFTEEQFVETGREREREKERKRERERERERERYVYFAHPCFYHDNNKVF